MGYLDGFRVTFKQMRAAGGKVVTGEYPKEKRPKAERMHGRHVLNRYEDGMEKCIGCELCAGVCPARCIYVRGADNPPDAPVSPGERYGFIYEINYLRCIHCDLCVEACPTEAITETKLFEFSFTNRQDAIYTREELLVDDDGRPQRLPWEDWNDRDAVDQWASAWMRATAPAGCAAYEDKVAWAGELGFGVRPPEHGQMTDTTLTGDDDVEADVYAAAAGSAHGGVDAHGHPAGTDPEAPTAPARAPAPPEDHDGASVAPGHGPDEGTP